MTLDRLTYADNVSGHGVAKGKVAGNSDKDINEGSDADASHHNASGAKVGVTANFIEY